MRRRFNVLQAWSVPAQGKLRWEVGGETGLSEPALASVLFLGTPILAESELLILGELNAELYLFALSPEDGHLLWSQQLVANQAALADDAIRRNLSCSPSVAAGIAVCPTLSGQLIAFDLATHSLRWASHYKVSPDSVSTNQTTFWGTNPSTDNQPLRLRSVDAAAMISDGCVVHAPSDSDSLYAVDLFDGRRLWKKERYAPLFVAAAWKDAVMVVNEQSVQSFRIRTGESVWEKPISLASLGRVAGRGVRNGSRYYLPLATRR